LLTNRIQALDHVAVDVNVAILRALHKQGLIDQIAQEIFFFRLNLCTHLLRRALLLAFVLNFGSKAGTSVVQVLARNDIIITRATISSTMTDLVCAGNGPGRKKNRNNQPLALFIESFRVSMLNSAAPFTRSVRREI